jgi:hypothetical protein
LKPGDHGDSESFAWRMTEPTDGVYLITILYISYNNNKEDSDDAEQYSNTCLLQLSLNWIEPAALGLRVFFDLCSVANICGPNQGPE